MKPIVGAELVRRLSVIRVSTFLIVLAIACAVCFALGFVAGCSSTLF